MASQLQELATMLPGGTFITFTVRFMHLCFVTSVPAFIDPVKKAIAAATVRPETSRDARLYGPRVSLNKFVFRALKEEDQFTMMKVTCCFAAGCSHARQLFQVGTLGALTHV